MDDHETQIAEDAFDLHGPPPLDEPPLRFVRLLVIGGIVALAGAGLAAIVRTMLAYWRP